MALIAEHKGNKVIAQARGLSERTVEIHRARNGKNAGAFGSAIGQADPTHC